MLAYFTTNKQIVVLHKTIEWLRTAQGFYSVLIQQNLQLETTVVLVRISDSSWAEGGDILTEIFLLATS